MIKKRPPHGKFSIYLAPRGKKDPTLFDGLGPCFGLVQITGSILLRYVLNLGNLECRERGETTGSKIMFSLSSVILFQTLGVDSCVFLIFTTRVGLKTRLNGMKSIFFEHSRKF